MNNQRSREEIKLLERLMELKVERSKPGGYMRIWGIILEEKQIMAKLLANNKENGI